MDNRQHSGNVGRPYRNLDRIFNRKPRESFKTRGQKKRKGDGREVIVFRDRVSKAAKIWKRQMLLHGRRKRGKVGVFVTWKTAREKVYEWYAKIAGAGGL